MKKLNFGLILVILVVLALGAYTLIKGSQEDPMGSIVQSQEYQATSTIGNHGIRESKIIKTGWGALGSVVVTGAGAMGFDFYDATTTEFTDGNIASSSAYLTSITASVAAGTYTFDLGFNDGLLIDIISNTALSATNVTSTITFR